MNCIKLLVPRLLLPHSIWTAGHPYRPSHVPIRFNLLVCSGNRILQQNLANFLVYHCRNTDYADSHPRKHFNFKLHSFEKPFFKSLFKWHVLRVQHYFRCPASCFHHYGSNLRNRNWKDVHTKNHKSSLDWKRFSPPLREEEYKYKQSYEMRCGKNV